MDEKADKLSAFILERCLWQFHSRSWDREENINGILGVVTNLLLNQKDKIPTETLMEKYFYADGKVLTDEFKEKFPWLEDIDAEKKKEIMEDVKKKITEIAVDKSRNEELRVPFY
ncbi:Fe-only/vanadium nitrogenase subunit delta [Clostridium luticellarii]|jgi:V-containing nitrogenase delta subunit|uniref:Fe-only/vanadium nitrogenase subunit delta n=1 Tax=Clostridium luticellarii TaxID=1691940 RepID=UPI0023561E71|nr:Fe-only/vanadium nitrogenase subunit delta [Clostridium luticellarii]MCI1945700.1 Fe-only/vanadium nitrogenase subunit delta [Clostridium luticellarii]MCI1969059.1 Fe-only/vanadium nitrogenase subunit delta [Clostridium luticellarii]MCI1996071.1 Fe-only/vanadium nitrogenase subunit delta [Clostridium luticellarii]MCI2040442.1 Fe-only/vanadium nitrogenase subunit delta [Clostridium luticellarii]